MDLAWPEWAEGMMLADTIVELQTDDGHNQDERMEANDGDYKIIVDILPRNDSDSRNEVGGVGAGKMLHRTERRR